MSNKVIQLEFLPKQPITLEEFQRTVIDSYKSLFAKNHGLRKQCEGEFVRVKNQLEQVEQVIFEIQKQVNCLAEAVARDA